MAICSPNGARRQSKTLFQAISDLRSWIVKGVFYYRLYDVELNLSLHHKKVYCICDNITHTNIWFTMANYF